MKRTVVGLGAPSPDNSPREEETPTLPGLPDKEYFRIGEAARLVGVKPYVLRYWESEFKRDIRPDRTRSNQRMYRRKDVQTFIEIKRLRYEEKLELPGARRRLRFGAPEEALPDLPDVPGELADDDTGRHAQEEGDLPAAEAPLRAAQQEAIRRGLEELLRGGLEELLRIVDEDEKGE